MACMVRPQFSLLRLLGAVTCCAVGIKAYLWLTNLGRRPSLLEAVIAAGLFGVMPLAALWLLSRSIWVVFFVTLVIFLCAILLSAIDAMWPGTLPF